jgi:TPR repeat protein
MQKTLDEECSSLGFTPIETLRRIGSGDDVAIRATVAGTSQVVVRFYPFSGSTESGGSDFEALAKNWTTSRFQTGSWATGSHSPSISDEKPSGATLASLFHEMTLRWSLAESCKHDSLAPILEFGHLGRHAFQVRPYYASTLLGVVEKQVSPNPQMLFRVVDQIWAALEFLHQPDVNQPHGNLTLANVALGAGAITDAPVFLLDLKETAETKRAESKRLDFQRLGLIIYRLASSFEGQIDILDALVRCKNASWSHLGKFEAEWKKLTQSLLDVGAYPAGHDLASRRQQTLAPLQPPKGTFRPKLPLHGVQGGPPLREFAPVKAVRPPKEPNAVASEVNERLAAGDAAGAMETALEWAAESSQSDAQVVAWCDEIAAAATAEQLSQSRLLALLEQAARLGSKISAFKLGQSLIDKYPSESLPWLEMAATAGMEAALPLLAYLHEWGGEGVEPNPEKAADYYQAAITAAPDPELHYRLGGLILRESSLSAMLQQAVASLEIGRSSGHFKATDLLAQCLSHGIGTEADEKRAFQLFTESWNRSKKTNEHYFTASNNLGVCFAIGFGTRKDPDLARHYFKQGEVSGHETSKKNLQALLLNR